MSCCVSLCTPCSSSRSAVSSPKPFLLQSGPPHLPQPLFTQLCPSEHLGSPAPNPLIYQCLSCSGSAQNCLWCFQWLWKVPSAREPWFPWIRVVVLLLEQPSATTLCCISYVQGCVCAQVLLTIDVSLPPALQRASFMCTHTCAGAHTCQITPPAALSSSCSILFHILQLSLVWLWAPWFPKSSAVTAILTSQLTGLPVALPSLCFSKFCCFKHFFEVCRVTVLGREWQAFAMGCGVESHLINYRI